jgi:hypothetical protein
VGASGWDYYAEYDEDLDHVLEVLQRRVVDTQDYYWGEDDVDRPTTLAEFRTMAGDEELESLAEEGTHSILDIHQVKPAGSVDEFGTLIALSAAEVVAAFGTDTPTRAQFDALYQGGMSTIVDFPRWSGRVTTLFEDGQPAGLMVWGYSGD